MPDGAKKNRQRDKLGTQRKNEKDNVVVNNYLGKAIENQVTTVCNLVKQNSSCNPWGCKCYWISPFVLTRRNGQFNFLTTEFYPHPPLPHCRNTNYWRFIHGKNGLYRSLNSQLEQTKGLKSTAQHRSCVWTHCCEAQTPASWLTA